MQLEELNISAQKLHQLKKIGYTSVESLLYTEPRKYYDFRKIYPLTLTQELKEKLQSKIPIALIGKCLKINSQYKNERSLIKIKLEDKYSKNILNINIIGEFKKLNYYLSTKGMDIFVGGILKYNSEDTTFFMLNPIIYSTDLEKYQRIIPVYKKHRNMSEDYFLQLLNKGINEVGRLDYVPYNVLHKYKLKSFIDTAKGFINPSCLEEIESSRKRKIFDDMLYFTCKLEEHYKVSNISSPFKIQKTKIMDEIINNLPFTLTNGQRDAIYGMISISKEGKRISSLVQGDVGSGKTIVALSLMIAMAENGFQSVLMAPTTILAKQHYEELKNMTEKYGFHTVFLANDIKASKKRIVYEEIQNGKANFIIGTNSCISNSVEYHNLGLTITDEEHKFGVLQREALLEKAEIGVHNIIMSGTPIPRTLANTFYGNDTQVYSMELPSNRQPIQTAICSSDKPVFDWLIKEIKKGRQAYVVCPLIDKAQESSKMEGVSSVEETFKKYEDYMKPYGIEVGIVTGNTKKEEQISITQKFKNNEIQILLATTVIEVGVNNPNATVIVITGAERFGLATLHQLRGRVGRGSYKSYCILQKSPNASVTNNLEILCRQTDGLEIAKEDLKNRGSGNILGTEQSGDNKYIDLLLTYPNMYKKVKEIAHELCKNNTGKDFIRIYESYFVA